jgi:hypothetical protein
VRIILPQLPEKEQGYKTSETIGHKVLPVCTALCKNSGLHNLQRAAINDTEKEKNKRKKK